MNSYEYKDKLQLEDWHNNNYLSQDMKRFFIEILNELDEYGHIRNRIEELDFEVKNIKLYLDGKGFKNDFTKFEMFMSNNPNSDLNAIRAYFRKQKIEKILNETFE